MPKFDAEGGPDMVTRARMATIVLVGVLALSSHEARSDDPPSGPVNRTQLDQAIATRLHDEDAARHTIRRLLQREDVQRLARGYGLDARRAEAAVGTLSGDELRRLSEQAAVVDSQLEGGDELVIRMSLVALLLVVIIAALLAKD
jgi:hypothetical protein